jgi:hypothetical protein
MSDAEKLQARRVELEALWDKVFTLTVMSGKSPAWAQEQADKAVDFNTGSIGHRDFIVNRRLRTEGLLHDQS